MKTFFCFLFFLIKKHSHLALLMLISQLDEKKGKKIERRKLGQIKLKNFLVLDCKSSAKVEGDKIAVWSNK